MGNGRNACVGGHGDGTVVSFSSHGGAWGCGVNRRLILALLCVYPENWRSRYGDELSSVIEEASAKRDRATVRIVLDVFFAGAGERLRTLGLGASGQTPEDRAKSGLLRVLWGWVFFTLGGIAVAKASEYWSNAVPVASRSLPSAAYGTLVVAAVIGSVGVVIGGVLSLPALVDFVRRGGWCSDPQTHSQSCGVDGLVGGRDRWDLVLGSSPIACSAQWGGRLLQRCRSGLGGVGGGQFVLLGCCCCSCVSRPAS